jgi:hypothetical protein
MIFQSFLASPSPFHDRVLLKMRSGIVSIAFRYGFRKEELQNLLCRQVKFAEKSIHLFQGTTENSQPRKVVLDFASLEEIRGSGEG